jgi:small neutral amino acid transporter SnatA (MarC family)
MKDTVVVVYNKERAIAIYSQLASHAWQTVKRRRTLKATFFSFLSLYVCLFSFAETVVSWWHTYGLDVQKSSKKGGSSLVGLSYMLLRSYTCFYTTVPTGKEASISPRVYTPATLFACMHTPKKNNSFCHYMDSVIKNQFIKIRMNPMCDWIIIDT